MDYNVCVVQLFLVLILLPGIPGFYLLSLMQCKSGGSFDLCMHNPWVCACINQEPPLLHGFVHARKLTCRSVNCVDLERMKNGYQQLAKVNG